MPVPGGQWDDACSDEPQSAIIAAMDGPQDCDKEAAWRIAVEQWLVKNRHISVFEDLEVSPCFSQKQSHN
jgi:hypothetical protein